MKIVEFFWSVVMIIDGLYLLLPEYTPQPGSVFINFVTSPYVMKGVAVLYIVAGILGLWGVYRGTKRARNLSTIVFFMAFLFTVMIRWLSVGFTPTVWVWPFLLAVVAAVHNVSLHWQEDEE